MSINSEILNSIVELIESNNELIQYDYKGKVNQILIPKNMVDKIYTLLSNLGIKKDDFKEITKQCIKNGFELSGNDIVISKNGEFFIKLYEKIKKHQVDETEKDTIVNRYNGINEDELEEFYDEFFEDSTNRHFFKSVAIEFVEVYLKDKKITNDIYEKSAFAYIHNITFEHLIRIYDNSDGFFKGFAGYIFRFNFKEVFEDIADLLLDEISMSNAHIIEFLKYYSQDIIVYSGKKYKVPSLESNKGLRWNVGSMLSITRIYTKSKRVIVELQKEIIELNTQVNKLYIGNLTPLEYQTAQIQKRQSFDNDIAHEAKRLERYIDTLNHISDEEQKHEIKKDIHLIRETLSKLREEQKNLLDETIDKAILSQYTHLQKEIDSLNRQLKREKLIITQNKASYQSIRESLIKALISKKQLL